MSVIKDLKDLQKVIQLCRKLGVSTIEVDGIKLALGPLPTKAPKLTVESQDPLSSLQVPQFTPVATASASTADLTPPEPLKEELTEDQLLFYSVANEPDAEAQ